MFGKLGKTRKRKERKKRKDKKRTNLKRKLSKSHKATVCNKLIIYALHV